MKVLLIAGYFPPEIGAGTYLPYEMGQTLVEWGHEVTVVTGFPQYNVAVVPKQYRGRMLMREEMAGMTVLRARAPIGYGKRKISRGLYHFVAPAVLAVRALGVKRPDVVFTWTPPLPLGTAACLVARRFGVPCVVNVQDLFPQMRHRPGSAPQPHPHSSL